jgi:cell division septation protein DedD
MCVKKSKRGVRSIVILLVLSVLALQPLAAWAWPSWLTGADKTEEQVELITPAPQSPQDNSQKQMIESLELYISQLENQLKEQKVMQQTLDKTLEASGTKISDKEASAESLLTELINLKKLLEISETSYSALKTDYNVLKADYDLKVDESNNYFKALADSESKLAAIDDSKWGGSIGASALLDPSDSKYGVGVSMGVGYDSWSLNVGADYYMPSGFTLSGFDFKDLDYRAGLRFDF